MSKTIQILEILQDYEIIKKDASLLLAERLTAMCAAEEIVELFMKQPKIDNVVNCFNSTGHLRMKKPKNGITNRMILGDFNYPWLLPAMWSEANNQWVVATIQSCECGGKEDPYFENEWFDDDELVKWVECPKLN